jgi:hypothetical protein
MGPRSIWRNVLVADDHDEARRLIHSALADDSGTGMLREATHPLPACALTQILLVDVVVPDSSWRKARPQTVCLPSVSLGPNRESPSTPHTEDARGACVLQRGADQLVRRTNVDVAGQIAWYSRGLAAQTITGTCG